MDGDFVSPREGAFLLVLFGVGKSPQGGQRVLAVAGPYAGARLCGNGAVPLVV